MVDNLRAKAIVQDKLSSTASKFKQKVGLAVKKMGEDRPTYQDPWVYRVVAQHCLVREGVDLSSPEVHRVPNGDVVTVVDKCGRRARITAPVEGWVSVESERNEQILRRVTGRPLERGALKKEAFQEAFDSKFNRLKKRQEGGDSREAGFDDSSRGDYHRSGPRDRDDSRDGDRDRDRDRDRDQVRERDRDRRRRDDSRGSSRSDRSDSLDRRDGRRHRAQGARGGEDTGPGSNAVVPRLTAPGSAGGPVVLAPPPSAASGAGAVVPQAASGRSGGSSGSAAAPAVAAAAASPAAAPDSMFDLLSLDTSSPATGTYTAQVATQAPWDPFGASPAVALSLNAATGTATGGVSGPCASSLGSCASAGASGWANFQCAGMSTGSAGIPGPGQQHQMQPTGWPAANPMTPGQGGAAWPPQQATAGMQQAMPMQGMGWGPGVATGMGCQASAQATGMQMPCVAGAGGYPSSMVGGQGVQQPLAGMGWSAQFGAPGGF